MGATPTTSPNVKRYTMNEQQQTIEQRVGATLLQQPRQISIAGKTYSVAPPTIATLILASEAISLLPQEYLDEEHIVEETLRIAKDCRVLGDILAILILGAKGLSEERTTEERTFFGLRRRRTVRKIDRKRELADELLETLAPRDLSRLISELLIDLQLGDFFGATTSLLEINLTKATRGVENETTAHGRSSEV